MSRYLLKLSLCLFITAFLSACETLYQPDGPSGGYSETQIANDIIRVMFRGNGVTSEDVVQNYVLYRCAEVTLEHGYDYFVILSFDDRVTDTPIKMPDTYVASTYSNFTANAYSTPYGATAYGSGVSNTYGTYIPGQTYNIKKYGSSVLIQMFHGQKPIGIMTAFDANFVINYLGKNIKRGY